MAACTWNGFFRKSAGTLLCFVDILAVENVLEVLSVLILLQNVVDLENPSLLIQPLL